MTAPGRSLPPSAISHRRASVRLWNRLLGGGEQLVSHAIRLTGEVRHDMTAGELPAQDAVVEEVEVEEHLKRVVDQQLRFALECGQEFVGSGSVHEIARS